MASVAPKGASAYISSITGNLTMAMTVQIRKEFEDLITRLVDSGRYLSEADVVDNALHFLEEREERREVKLAKLRAEIQKGIDSGPAVEFDPNELCEDIKRRGRERLAAERRANKTLAAKNG